MSDVLRDSTGVLRRHLPTMQLDQAREGFALAATRPGNHAKLIALLEREPVALQGQCDRHRARSPSRELVAKMALSKLAPPRPHTPFFTEEATKQSLTTLVAASE